MLKFAANLSWLFTDQPFLERFALAAAAGFVGVEYMFPYAWPASEIKERLAAHGLSQVLINLPAGNWEAGERGIATRKDRVEEFRRGVAQAIEYGKALDCRQINCLVGVTTPDADPAQCRAVLIENLGFAARSLADEGIRLLIEPVNTRDIPGFYVSRTSQALEIINAVASDNIFVQYDVYHMQIMEGDLAHTLEAHKSQIGHIQVADNPGRHEPGTGEINFPFLFRHIDRIGYEGWIGCEYKPAGTTVEGLGWLRSYATRGEGGSGMTIKV